MNNYLLSERIKKGETAGKRLAGLKWPANLHQKLIDKKYNAKFKSVSPTPATKLAKTADLWIPILPPGEYKKEKKKITNLAAGALVLRKQRLQIEKNLLAFMQLRNRKLSKVDEFRKQALVYKKEAEKVLKNCVESAKACPGVEFTHTARIGSYNELTKAADKLEAALDKSDADYDKVLKGVGKKMRELKKTEDAWVKDIFETTKFVIGMYIVMP